MNQIVFIGSIDGYYKRLYYLSATLLAGAFIYLSLLLFSKPQNLIVLAALPSLVSLCFYMSNENKSQEEWLEMTDTGGSFRNIFTESTKIIPFRVLNGLLFGLSLSIAISTSVNETGAFSIITAVALCLPGPFMLGLFALNRGRVDIPALQWVLICMIQLALIVSSLLNSVSAVICFSIVAFCFVLFQGTHMTALAELIHDERLSAFLTLALGMLIISLGIAVGWIIGTALLVFFGYDGVLYRATIVVVSAVFFLSVAYQGRPRKALPMTLPGRFKSDSEGRWRRACFSLIEEAALSPRQAEVFAYLVKGRNAAFIANDLVVSEHTVKAHIHRIYQKMKVHSQQDLIGLVEAQMKHHS
jgi:DNA-binding CsgD family transcriptional regulator